MMTKPKLDYCKYCKELTESISVIIKEAKQQVQERIINIINEKIEYNDFLKTKLITEEEKLQNLLVTNCLRNIVLEIKEISK